MAGKKGLAALLRVQADHPDSGGHDGAIRNPACRHRGILSFMASAISGASFRDVLGMVSGVGRLPPSYAASPTLLLEKG